MMCHGLRLAAALSAALALAACSSIPANTPKLIDLTTDRIENQSTVLIKGYQTVLDQSRFSKDDAADARQELDKIDANKLTADEQKAFAAAQKAIANIQNGLNFKANYDTLPGNSKRVFEETVASLKTVRQVIATEVDKKQLVQDAMQALNQVKGDAK